MTTPSTPLYREIPLTQGQVALVSAHRFDELNAYKWWACWISHTRTFYAFRKIKLENGRRVVIGMHREILGLKFGDKRQGEHKNQATLDNRDENLRIATSSQNQCNRGPQRNNKSGFKGVSWYKRDKKWRACIEVKGKRSYLGLFDTPELAYEKYCLVAKQIHGDFAWRR